MATTSAGEAAMNEAVIYDSADVYANGSTSWARHRFRSIRLPFDLNAFGLPQDEWNTYAYDGLLAPRFAPSQRAWVLSGVRVAVSPTVDASTGRDADDR